MVASVLEAGHSDKDSSVVMKKGVEIHAQIGTLSPNSDVLKITPVDKNASLKDGEDSPARQAPMEAMENDLECVAQEWLDDHNKDSLKMTLVG